MHVLRALGARLGRGAAALVLASVASAVAFPSAAQVPIPPLDSPVVDTTDTLSTDTREALVQQAVALQARKGSQLQVLMVPTTGDETVDAYAQRVFDAWKLGRKGVDDGVLLVIAKNDRNVRIHTGYGLEGAIPDITARRVIDEYLVPNFRAGDFDSGVREATGALVALIDGEPLPPPMSGTHSGGEDDGAWIMGLFLVAIVAHIFMNRVPPVTRGLLFGLSLGSVVGLVTFNIPLAIFVFIVGFIFGVANMRGGGRFARNGVWHSSGGWSSSSSSSSGGGWSGGGGSSGGGGASGSW